MEQAQAEPGLKILGVCLEKHLIVGLGFLDLTQLLMNLREVDVGLGHGRIQVQGLVESIDGVLVAALLKMNHSQQMPGGGVPGIDPEPPVQVHASRLHLLLSKPDLGSHSQPPGVLGLQLDEGVEVLDRLIQFLLLEVDHCQVVTGGGEGGRDVDRPLEELGLLVGELVGGPDKFLPFSEPLHRTPVDLGACLEQQPEGKKEAHDRSVRIRRGFSPGVGRSRRNESFAEVPGNGSRFR